MLSRGASDRRAARGEEVGAGSRANCFNKATGGTVGRWLNPVIDLEARAPRRGNSAREREIFKFLHYPLKESLMLDGIARNIIILLF